MRSLTMVSLAQHMISLSHSFQAASRYEIVVAFFLEAISYDLNNGNVKDTHICSFSYYLVSSRF